MLPLPPPNARAALVVAHPGHELRVYGWLKSARPSVFVVTDGSGHSSHSRLPSTTKILNQIGAEPGSIYGRLSDAAAYTALLNHDFDLFVNLAQELTTELLRETVDYVAGDAMEGYNPTHDVCRLVLNAAVDMAGRTRGREIGNFDFSLVSPPDACPEALRPHAIWLHLADDVFTRKLAAALAYPELAAEVDAAFRANTVEAFRVECLRPVSRDDRIYRFVQEPPYYERYGEGQVAAGYYDHVIRYREHILPLADALRRHVQEGR